jgi:hypothetical protein
LTSLTGFLGLSLRRLFVHYYDKVENPSLSETSTLCRDWIKMSSARSRRPAAAAESQLTNGHLRDTIASEKEENIFLFAPNLIGYLRIVLALASLFYMPLHPRYPAISALYSTVSRVLTHQKGHAQVSTACRVFWMRWTDTPPDCFNSPRASELASTWS